MRGKKHKLNKKKPDLGHRTGGHLGANCNFATALIIRDHVSKLQEHRPNRISYGQI